MLSCANRDAGADPRERKNSDGLLTWLVRGYLSVVLSLVIGNALLGAKSPFFALLGVFYPFLFFPLGFVLLFALVRYRRHPLILPAVGVLVLLFGIKYGAFFLPQMAVSAPDARQQLAVMTFNVGLSTQPEPLVQLLRSSECDVIALQELTPEIAAYFDHALAQDYPFRVWNTSTYDVGLLSRYPIADASWFFPAGEGRAALHATVLVDADPLHVFVLHPLPPGIAWYKPTQFPLGLYDSAVYRDLRAVAQRVAALDAPLLLLGDLNTHDQSAAYAQLAALLKDAYREAGWGFGFTFPRGLRVRNLAVPGPFVRLDYIFHSDDFSALRAKVHCTSLSDHCYLVATLGWGTQ